MQTNWSLAPRTVRFSGQLRVLLAVVGAVAVASPAAADAQTATPVPQSGPGAAAAPSAPPAATTQPAATPPGAAAPPPRYPAYQAPPDALAPNGQYVAPLSQTTQPVYVPQSVALSGPRFIKDWHDGDAIPYGYHREERVRKGEVIAGSILFGVPYLYSSLIASIGNDAGSSRVDALWIPVLGPFIELKESDSTTLSYILILDGVVQGVGAAMAIHGLTTPRPLLVRNDLGSVSLAPTPMGKNGQGVMFMGRF